MSVTGIFVSASTTRECAAGELIFEQGDPSSEMYGVVSGAVELIRDGNVVARVEADGTFGEMGIIDGSARSLTAVAAEATTIAVIDDRTFIFLVQETPMFALQVMRSLAARIRELDAR